MAGPTTPIDDAIKFKMSQLCRRIARPAVNSIFRWNVSFLDTVSSVRRFFKSIWDRISPSSCSSSSSASCFSAFIVSSHRRDLNRDSLSGSRRISNNVNDSSGRSGRSNNGNDIDVVRNSTSGSCQYTRLQGSSPTWLQRRRRRRHRRVSGQMAADEEEEEEERLAVRCFELERSELDSDYDNLVPLKISCLGDCNIGKTSFVVKYIGDEQEKNSLQMSGLNLMDKTLLVGGARIAFSIWDVGGDHSSMDHLPIACKDAVAILFMFDLTSRCTLHNVIGWFSQARKWNQTAIPVLIGTKFDDFARLPPDLQSTIITQARAYARAMKATLFFSSATHNINVNKIFKFIMAKLFNLPWTPQRNLTVGEPIIDFF